MITAFEKYAGITLTENLLMEDFHNHCDAIQEQTFNQKTLARRIYNEIQGILTEAVAFAKNTPITKMACDTEYHVRYALVDVYMCLKLWEKSNDEFWYLPYRLRILIHIRRFFRK